MIHIGTITPYGYRFHKKTKRIESISGTKMKFDFTFPDGFCIVIDSREQAPLFLEKPPKGLVLVRDTLATGDYSVRGWESRFTIERKGVNDLWSSLTVDGERFRRELERMKSYEVKYILVEAPESEYLVQLPERKISVNAIRQALASVEGKMFIPVHSAESRADAERWLIDVAIKFFHGKRNGQC